MLVHSPSPRRTADVGMPFIRRSGKTNSGKRGQTSLQLRLPALGGGARAYIIILSRAQTHTRARTHTHTHTLERARTRVNRPLRTRSPSHSTASGGRLSTPPPPPPQPQPPLFPKYKRRRASRDCVVVCVYILYIIIIYT